MLEMIRALENNGGLTLKAYKAVTYKTGWQVADRGVECHSAEEAVAAIEAMNGSCGVWLENGIYYIDHSFRVKTKREALEIGRAHNQISILCWERMTLAYC